MKIKNIKNQLSMRGLFTVAIGVLAATLCAGGAQAATIGALSLDIDGVTVNGSSLTTSTVFNPFGETVDSQGGGGVLGYIPANVASTSTALNISGPNEGNYDFSIPGFGSWVTTSATSTFISSRALSAQIEGIFSNPQTGESWIGSMIIQINQSGTGEFARYSWSSTIEVTDDPLPDPLPPGVPSAVPEPAAFAFVGMGLTGLALIRRKYAKA